MTSPPALLIAGHGTRDESAAAAFQILVEELGAAHPGLPVVGGCVPPDTPALADALEVLAEHGASQVVTVPLSLAPDGRMRESIAAALADARLRHPGTLHALAGPVGTHAMLLDLLERRLDEALGNGVRTPSDRAGTTVLLVSDGSSDPVANAEVHRAARLLWEGRGFAGVETAFVSLAAPDVASGLDRCARLGARRVVVLPYLLFPGGLADRAWQQAEGAALAYPWVEVVRAEPIGPAKELITAVMDRYREAVETHVR